MILRFLDSDFCTKFQISQPGWYPDQAIKIRHIPQNPSRGGAVEGVVVVGGWWGCGWVVVLPWKGVFTLQSSVHHKRFFIFYCLVSISDWLWNLQFVPQNWNPKTLELFCMPPVIRQVNTSFWYNFSHLLTIFGDFLSGGKKLRGFQPGHKIDKNTCQKCEKRSESAKKYVKMTAKRFLWRQTRKKGHRDFWIPIFVQNSRFHNQAGTLTRRHLGIFIARSGYQPGCENWNLLPKIGIQILLSYFCMSHVITQVDTSFWGNFSHFWAIFSHFYTHFVCFATRLKSSKLLTTR